MTATPAFTREPIFWSTTQKDSNRNDRERVIVVDGEQRVEKFPQTGHLGDYENKVKAPGQRYVKVCRTEGNVVSLVMTNAAAHLDTNTSFATSQRRKCVHLGWFPAAGCVAKLVAGGELDREHLAVPLEDEIACEPDTHSLDKPCPHTKREIAARQVRNKRHNDKREAAYKSSDDKMLEAQRETNDKLVDILNAGAGKRGRQKAPSEADE